MKLYIYILIFIFSGCNFSYAQENNFWPIGCYFNMMDTAVQNHLYFLLDFNSSPLKLDTLPPDIVPSYRGVFSSLCDSTGKLLLYNNWLRIYNNKNVSIAKVPPGSLSNSLFLRDPGNPNIAHFININAGLVDITFKLSPEIKYIRTDTLIHNYYGMNNLFPYIEAVKMQGDNGYWLIFNSSIDTFMVYSFTKTGIRSAFKYVSNVEDISSALYQNINVFNSSLQASNDGRLLVFTYKNMLRKDLGFYQSGVIFYNFDPSTGIISHGTEILKDTGRFYKNDSFWVYRFSAYDNSAFSPNDSLVYVINQNLVYNKGRLSAAPILQIDRYKEKVICQLPLKTMHSYGGIQLAPDGKIYYGASNYRFYQDTAARLFGNAATSAYYTNLEVAKAGASIGVIQSPDTRGIGCNIIERLFSFPNTIDEIYFPNIFYKYLRVKFKAVNVCQDSMKFINQSDTENFSQYTWFFSAQDSINGFNASWAFPYSGKYLVRLRATTPAGYKVWYYDSIVYVRPPKALFSAQYKTGCQYVAYVLYDKSFADTTGSSGNYWVWNFGDGESMSYSKKLDSVSHTYFQPGYYTIRLVFSNGYCTDTFIQTEQVNIFPAPKPGFALDENSYCTPARVKITDESEGEVSDFIYVSDNNISNEQNPEFLFSSPGNYIIRQKLKGPSGCITEDSASITVHQGVLADDNPQFLLATHLNNDTVLLIWKKMPGAANYILSSRKNQFEKVLQDTFCILPYQSGYYELKALDSCGNFSALSTIKTLQLSGHPDENENANLQWNQYSYWPKDLAYYILQEQNIDGNWDDVLQTKDTSAILNVLFKDKCSEHCFRVISYEGGNYPNKVVSNTICLHPLPRIWMPNVFSPNNDSLNDEWAPITVSIISLDARIFNRWGELVWEGSGEKISWKGNLNGTSLPEGLYYYVLEAKTLDNNTIYKKGNILLIK